MLPEHLSESCAFPCNSKPFLERIREILDQANTNSLQSLTGEEKIAARACMWVLMGQLYGQMARIDLCDEWDKLHKSHLSRRNP